MFKKRDQPAPAPKDDQIVEKLLGSKKEGGEIDGRKTRRVRQLSTFEGILRTFGMVVGICIIGFGVFSYLSTDFSAASMKKDLAMRILPFYIAFSGLIILGVECGIGFLRNSMKFLTKMIGRGIFSIYVGLMCMCVVRPDNSDFEKIIIYIIVSLLLLLGILSIFGALFCCKTHVIRE